MALIAAGTSRGNKLIRHLLPQNISPENSKWDYAKMTEDVSVQTSSARDAQQIQKDLEEHRLKEHYRSLANPPAGTIYDSDESSNTSEYRKQHTSAEAEEEETKAHNIPEGIEEVGSLGDEENGTAAT